MVGSSVLARPLGSHSLPSRMVVILSNRLTVGALIAKPLWRAIIPPGGQAEPIVGDGWPVTETRVGVFAALTYPVSPVLRVGCQTQSQQ
jgi:hypothetical protein